MDCSEVAYCKMLLHSAKYPLKPTMGVLVGNDTVTDYIPVLHSLIGPVNIALELIQVYCRNLNIQILGFYTASLHSTVELLAAQHDAFICVLNSGNISQLVGNDWVHWPVPQSCSRLIQSRAYANLYDFENHLENVQLDWLKNSQLELK
jgi:hypothetical protein